jgi:hypothetical protein
VDPVPGKGTPNAELITEEVFAQAIDIARNDLRSRGMNPSEYPLMVSLENDPTFRATYLAALKDMVRTGGDRSQLEQLMKSVK